MHARNNGEKPTLCFGDEKLFRPMIISSTFGPAQSLGPAFPIPGTRSYGEDSAGRRQASPCLSGRGLLLGGGEERGRDQWKHQSPEAVSGSECVVFTFVALGRCSVHICSSREGAPRGNLGHRPSQPLSVYYSTSQGTGRNRGSRKCQ